MIDFLAGRAMAMALIDGLPVDDLAISISSVVELLDGVARTKDPPEAIRRLHLVLEPFEIMQLDFETATIFGALRSSLRGAGTRLADFALLIAATALRHDVTLVTRNRRHFDRIPGLRLYESEG